MSAEMSPLMRQMNKIGASRRKRSFTSSQKRSLLWILHNLMILPMSSQLKQRHPSVHNKMKSYLLICKTMCCLGTLMHLMKKLSILCYLQIVIRRHLQKLHVMKVGFMPQMRRSIPLRKMTRENYLLFQKARSLSE